MKFYLVRYYYNDKAYRYEIWKDNKKFLVPHDKLTRDQARKIVKLLNDIPNKARIKPKS